MLNNPVTGGESPQQSNVNSEETKQDHASGERGMYSSITIENFRLFEHLKLDDLARVNLFFGPNNCGKTSILEAVYTHACGLNFASFRGRILQRRRGGLLTGPLDLGEHLISLFRDRSSLPYTFAISANLVADSSMHTVMSMFHPSSELADLDPRTLGQFSGSISSSSSSTLSIANSISPEDLASVTSSSEGSSSSVRSMFLGIWQTRLNRKLYELELRFPRLSKPLLPQPQFKPVNLHDTLDHRHPTSEIRVFSHLKRYKILDEFAEEMAKAFPGISKIDNVPYPDGTQGPVYVEMGDQWLPLFVFGDGMRRWFYLLGHMLVNRNAIHCIEEIDSSFHPDAHEDLSRLLIQYAEKYENQLFLTSHSIEFADAFLEALYGEDGILASSDEDPVRVFTIRPTKDYGHPEIWKFTGKEAYENRSHYDLELR